jgi:transposase
MPKEQTPGKPQTRRYSDEEKAAAVRMVRTLRAELGTEHGTVQRVATQLGYGVESVRQWVKQAEIDDGHAPGITTAEARRIRELEQENRELFGRHLVEKYGDIKASLAKPVFSPVSLATTPAFTTEQCG